MCEKVTAIKWCDKTSPMFDLEFDVQFMWLRRIQYFANA